MGSYLYCEYLCKKPHKKPASDGRFFLAFVDLIRCASIASGIFTSEEILRPDTNLVLLAVVRFDITI